MEPLKQFTIGEDSPGLKLRNVLSIVASAAVSFLILFGIIQAQKTAKIEEDPGFEELRSVVMPSPPPPPPEMDRFLETPPPPSLLQLEVSPMDNPLQLNFSLTPVSSVVSPPRIEPEFDFSTDAFRPTQTRYKSKHVYSKPEVDQPPVAVYKRIPEIDQRVLERAKIANIRLMYIVNTEGKVEAVSLIGSGGKSFDAIVMDGVKQWRFKPAIKDGRKVNCWVRQRITVTSGHMESPFTL